MTIAHGAVMLVAVVACAIDLRTRRIPNVLTFGAAAGGLVFSLATRGVAGGLESLTGMLVGAALMFVLFALGGMGAGDVKLLGALGAWLGPFDAIWLSLYTGIAGGVIALVVAVLTGYLGQACRNIVALFGYWAVVGVRPMTELTLDTSRGPRLAYATAILAGTVATVWLR
jgi:prepilin peptidase CpaA